MTMSRQISLVLRSVIGPVSVLVLAATVAGCASSSADLTKALNPDPPGKIYADADAMLAHGKHEAAAKKFEELDRHHPYAQEARRAMVMAAFAYYKAGKYPEAIASAKRYTTMHPGTKDAALAHHVIASSNFDEIKDPTRDQTATRQAMVELKTLIQRYPDSQYAQQAENRLRLGYDALAASEMQVGRYYMKRNNHVAAINRFKTVISDYQTTAHVEEALMRLTEMYLALGIANEAQATAAVLGHNFPHSRWYKDTYALLEKQGLKPENTSGSWVSQQWRTVDVKPKGKPPTTVTVPTRAPSTSPVPPIDLPPARAPRRDVPTVSTPTTPGPMGVGLN